MNGETIHTLDVYKRQDINKAKKILNYTCNTDIESGIRKFIEQKESLLLLRSNNENNPIKNK